MQKAMVMLIVVIVCAMNLSGVPEPKGLEVFWCDVEGGAATLIVTPARESLLVDSGWPGERDAPRIARLAKEVAGVSQIDHYLTTHWHTDHFGGSSGLADLIPIRNFYDHGFPQLPASDIRTDLVEAYRKVSGGKSTILKPGDQVPLKRLPGTAELNLRILAAHGIALGESGDAPQVRGCEAVPKHHPAPVDTSDNARSLAFLLRFGEWEFFDAGDLTLNVEHKLVCPANLVGEVDVYQVTHHGMDTSNHPALVGALRPRVAIMNNGARKGGSPGTIRILKGAPGLQALFALHRNVQTGMQDNAATDLVANDDEQCRGEFIRLSVSPDGRSYSVNIPSKGTSRTFATKP